MTGASRLPYCSGVQLLVTVKDLQFSPNMPVEPFFGCVLSTRPDGSRHRHPQYDALPQIARAVRPQEGLPRLRGAPRPACPLARVFHAPPSAAGQYFHFELNRPEVLAGPLLERYQNADAITAARAALFNVVERHEGVVMVLRVERCGVRALPRPAALA